MADSECQTSGAWRRRCADRRAAMAPPTTDGHVPKTEKRESGPISRILCPGTRGGGHLSRAPIAQHLLRPTRGSGEQPVVPMGTSLMLGLAPGGVCLAEPVTWPAGGLLHHRFTLAGLAGALLSVALFRRITPPGRYPAPCSVEFGLSSGRTWRHATARPTLPHPWYPWRGVIVKTSLYPRPGGKPMR